MLYFSYILLTITLAVYFILFAQAYKAYRHGVPATFLSKSKERRKFFCGR